MTAQTNRYNMVYPTGGDPLSSITTLLKNMCESIDKALAQVDDRNNVGGVKPIVRATLAELKLMQGVIGQTGYVTTGDETGVYHFTGRDWAPDTPHVIKTTISAPYSNNSKITLVKTGTIVTASGVIYGAANISVTAQRVSETIPPDFAPMAGTLPVITALGTNNTVFYLEVHPEGYMEMSGNMNANYRYGFSGTWVTD